MSVQGQWMPRERQLEEENTTENNDPAISARTKQTNDIVEEVDFSGNP